MAAKSGAAVGEDSYRVVFLAGDADGSPSPGVDVCRARHPLGLKATAFALRIVKLHNPSVVIFSLWKSIVAFLLARAFVRHTRLVLLLHAERPVHLLDQLAHAVMLRLADAVWADSKTTLDARYPRGDRRKPTRVVSFLARRIDGKIRPIPSPRFIFWGRLAPQKNLQFALEIFGRTAGHYPMATFTIIGRDAGSRAALQSQVRALHLENRVIFHDELPFEQIREAGATAGFFLQTSTFEGMAMAVVEAMQLGLVPVVTPVGEIGNYCHHLKNAIVVHSLDQAESDLRSVLSDRALYARLSASAIETWREARLYKDDIAMAAAELLQHQKNSAPELTLGPGLDH